MAYCRPGTEHLTFRSLASAAVGQLWASCGPAVGQLWASCGVAAKPHSGHIQAFPIHTAGCERKSVGVALAGTVAQEEV
jgi:hypothetical protein